MTREGWVLSARLAWSRPAMRWTAILALTVCIAVSVWFLVVTAPAAERHDAFVFHYNIYLGTDDVRAWPWVFSLPAAWLVLTLADMTAAFGLYRTDLFSSRALAALAVTALFPWMGILFYLSLE